MKLLRISLVTWILAIAARILVFGRGDIGARVCVILLVLSTVALLALSIWRLVRRRKGETLEPALIVAIIALLAAGIAGAPLLLSFLGLSGCVVALFVVYFETLWRALVTASSREPLEPRSARDKLLVGTAASLVAAAALSAGSQLAILITYASNRGSTEARIDIALVFANYIPLGVGLGLAGVAFAGSYERRRGVLRLAATWICVGLFLLLISGLIVLRYDFAYSTGSRQLAADVLAVAYVLMLIFAAYLARRGFSEVPGGDQRSLLARDRGLGLAAISLAASFTALAASEVVGYVFKSHLSQDLVRGTALISAGYLAIAIGWILIAVAFRRQQWSGYTVHPRRISKRDSFLAMGSGLAAIGLFASGVGLVIVANSPASIYQGVFLTALWLGAATFFAQTVAAASATLAFLRSPFIQPTAQHSGQSA